MPWRTETVTLEVDVSLCPFVISDGAMIKHESASFHEI
jgi:uncharacterized protein CbrC (UPF0167 family)